MMRDFAIAAGSLAAMFGYAWWERRAWRQRHQPEYLVGAFDREPLVPADAKEDRDAEWRGAA